MKRRELLSSLGVVAIAGIAPNSLVLGTSLNDKKMALSSTSSLETTSTELKDAWESYYAAIDEMRQLIETSPRFQKHPKQRAKAYHTLMEMQAIAYNFAVAPRMLHPRILRNIGWQTDIYSMVQNCPDFIYGILFVDGRQTYRLSGRMGDLSMILLQTDSGFPVGGYGTSATGNYDWADFEIAKDGTFEIIISAAEQPGNWIKLSPESKLQFLFIRRALQNWHGDPGELNIQRISDVPVDFYDADEFEENAMAVRIRNAEIWLRHLAIDGNIKLYNRYLKTTGGQKNILAPQSTETLGSVASPTSNYAMGVFEIKDDEALIIELDNVHESSYWSFSLSDVWSRTLNFTHRQTSINDFQAVIDGDGVFRAVLSQKDPGIANWLDASGYNEGTIVFRNYRSASYPIPKIRKVKFVDISAFLPHGTALVTKEQREKNIQYRRLGMLKIYGE